MTLSDLKEMIIDDQMIVKPENEKQFKQKMQELNVKMMLYALYMI